MHSPANCESIVTKGLDSQVIVSWTIWREIGQMDKWPKGKVWETLVGSLR